MDVLLSIAFLAGLFIMYWSMPLGCLLYKIRFLTFRGKRDDIFQWAKFVVDTFRITLRKVGGHELYRTSEPVIYLANHRCWADFFLDVYLTEGRGVMLSRWAVFPVFPVFLTSALLLKSVIFFKRNRVVDKHKFNATLDANLRESPANGLIVYPEGHRSTLPTSLPLRRGMLHYAHSRKMHVQIVITKGKEQVMSEKQLKAGFGAHLMVGYSEVVRAKEFDNFEDFMAKVQSVWDALWKQVYFADDKCPLLNVQAEQSLSEYTLQMKVLQAVYGACAIAVLFLFLLGWLRLALWAPYGMVVSVGALSLTVIAIQRATLPPPTM